MCEMTIFWEFTQARFIIYAWHTCGMWTFCVPVPGCTGVSIDHVMSRPASSCNHLMEPLSNEKSGSACEYWHILLSCGQQHIRLVACNWPVKLLQNCCANDQASVWPVDHVLENATATEGFLKNLLRLGSTSPVTLLGEASEYGLLNTKGSSLSVQNSANFRFCNLPSKQVQHVLSTLCHHTTQQCSYIQGF